MALPNHELVKRTPGRPRLWKTPADLDQKLEEFRQYCEEQKKPFTLSGLAVALGCDRRTLVEYSQRDEFFPTIKRARAYAEQYLEEYLLSGRPLVGAIFVAKNNFGWVDAKDITYRSIKISDILAKITNEDIIEGSIVPHDQSS